MDRKTNHDGYNGRFTDIRYNCRCNGCRHLDEEEQRKKSKPKDKLQVATYGVLIVFILMALWLLGWSAIMWFINLMRS